mmetsp:Transcript_7426/g.17939  ORF Transcript_7426/g.17939 Transcript_7426/m.17939 type:complete len:1164 (-) Transcript_7426:24-3515(-)
MGIKNLHRLLQPMTKKVALNQEDWGGKRVGVDAMCWMHRGAVSCAYELIVGIDTDKFVKFFVDMVLMLQWHSIIPFIVFDGCDLPAKQEEAASRKKNRDEGREKVLEKARELGDRARFDVMTTKFAQQGIRITVDMVERILAALREMSVEFLVAPFEADAQLSFLCRTGFLHAVISEDSDLFVYNCPRVLAKLDKYGEADLFDMTKILGKENTREIPEASLNSFEKIKTAVEKEYEGLREEKVVEGVVEGTWEKIDAGGGDFDEDAEDDHAAAPEDEEVEAEENKANGQEENGDDADAEDARATNEEANAGGELKEGTHFLRAAGAVDEQQENKKNKYDGNLLQLDEDLDIAFDERPDVEAPSLRLQNQLNRTASVASASVSSAVTSSNSAGTSCTSGNNSSVEVIVLDSSQEEESQKSANINKSKIVKSEIVDLVEDEEESGPEQMDHAEDKETRRPTKKSSVFEQIMAEEALAEAAVKSTTKGRKGRAKRASKKEVGEGGTTGEQGNAAGKIVMKKDGKEKKARKQPRKKAAPKKPMKKKPPQKVPNLKFDIAFFKEWTPEQFRVFCVLSGCDYNGHLHVQKLAIGTAAKLVHCFKERTLDAVLKKFDLPCTPLEYVQNFHLSLSVFRHHVVYDAKKGDVLFFSEALKRVKRLQIQSVDPAMCETLCGCPLREKAVGDVNGMMIASGAGGKSSRGSGGGVSSCNLNDLGLGGMHHVKQNQRIPRNKNDFVRVCRGELRPKTFEERPKDPLSRAEKEMLKRLRTRRMADLRRDAELKKRNGAVGMENFASDFGEPAAENALRGAVGAGGKFSPVSINFGTASSTSRHRQSHRFVTPPSGFAGADLPDLKRPRVAPEYERSLDPSLMSFKEQVRHEEEQWAMQQRREDREWEKQQQEEREFMREHLTEVGMAVPPTVNAVIGAGGGAVGAAARCNQRPQAPPRAPAAVGMGIFGNFNGGFFGGASSSSSASAASSSSAAGAAGLFVAGGGGAGAGPGIQLAGVAPTGSSTGGSNDGFGTGGMIMNTNINNIFGMSNLSAQQQGAASRHGQPQGGTTTSSGVNKSNPFRRRGGGAAAPAQPKLSSMPNANCRPAQMNVMGPGVAGFSTTMGGAAGGGGGTGSSTSINAATRMFGNRDPRKYAEETKNNMLPYHKKKNPTGGMYF